MKRGRRPIWALVLIAAPITGLGCSAEQLRVSGSPGSQAKPGSLGIEPAEAGMLQPSAAQEVLVHLDMARALESQGQPDKAIAEYQRAVQKYRPALARAGSAEQRAKLHRRLGAAHDRLGRFDAAANHYAEARKLTPQDPKVWNDSGYSAYLQGNWDVAVNHLRKAVQLDPSDPRAQTNLGLALAAQGQTDEAYRILTQAGGPATAHANIAYVLASQGKSEEARAYYQKVLEDDAKNKVARRALATLDRRPAPEPEISLTGHEAETRPAP